MNMDEAVKWCRDNAASVTWAGSGTCSVSVACPTCREVISSYPRPLLCLAVVELANIPLERQCPNCRKPTASTGMTPSEAQTWCEDHDVLIQATATCQKCGYKTDRSAKTLAGVVDGLLVNHTLCFVCIRASDGDAA